MAFLPSIVDGDDRRPFTLGFVGDISSFSERTLAYSVFYAIFYVLSGYVPVLKPNKPIDEHVMKLLIEMRERVLQGRLALLIMVTYALKNRNNPEFYTPMPAGLDGE
jgi:hypothetical protein